MANTNYVVIGSKGVSVAPDNAGVASSIGKGRPRGHVTITPLSEAQRASLLNQGQGTTAMAPPVKKVLLKAVNRENGKVHKLFTLRNLESKDMNSCDSLKSFIRSQLYRDIIDGSFDVGVVQTNSSAVSFRSKEDLREVWEQLHMGKNVTLWCDGMAVSNKRKRPCEIEDEEVERKKSKKKSDTTREEKVQKIVDELKVKHGEVYTPMQFRIWAEMIVGGVHISQDDPPSTTMFNRSGSVNVKKKTSSDVVTQV